MLALSVSASMQCNGVVELLAPNSLALPYPPRRSYLTHVQLFRKKD